MPTQTIPGQQLTYSLINFDDKGKERTDDPEGGVFSQTILAKAKAEQPTNIFLFSHGWKGDVPSAIDQYNRWIGAMWKLDADKQAMGPGFKPMFIGLHWPSQPWGDESPTGSASSFGTGGEEEETADLDSQFEATVQHFGGSKAAREALDVLFAAQKEDPNPETLSTEVLAAYRKLADAVGFEGSGDASAPPEKSTTALDPQGVMEAERSQPAAFGLFDKLKKGVLSGLRQVSFFIMMNRARTVGEAGMHQFVAALQKACPGAAVHLMGHSFGCIVVSSILGGPSGRSSLARPVNSAVLVQGAFSLWGYADNIRKLNKPGYFRSALVQKSVNGPLVTTMSVNDSAVGVAYPIAMAVVPAQDFAVDDLPDIGAVGRFGIQGTTVGENQAMLRPNGVYNFAAGRIYNLESSDFIPSHSGIDGPEVAHVIWQAARAMALGATS